MSFTYWSSQSFRTLTHWQSNKHGKNGWYWYQIGSSSTATLSNTGFGAFEPTEYNGYTGEAYFSGADFPDGTELDSYWVTIDDGTGQWQLMGVQIGVFFSNGVTKRYKLFGRFRLVGSSTWLYFLTDEVTLPASLPALFSTLSDNQILFSTDGEPYAAGVYVSAADVKLLADDTIDFTARAPWNWLACCKYVYTYRSNPQTGTPSVVNTYEVSGISGA